MTISVHLDAQLLGIIIQALASILGSCLAAVITYKLATKRKERTRR